MARVCVGARQLLLALCTKCQPHETSIHQSIHQSTNQSTNVRAPPTYLDDGRDLPELRVLPLRRRLERPVHPGELDRSIDACHSMYTDPPSCRHGGEGRGM